MSQVNKLFPGFETMPQGRVADRIQLVSDVNWKQVVSENIYAVVPGTHPELGEQAVMVEAFYDSTFWVAGRSPGADEEFFDRSSARVTILPALPL